MSCITCNHCYKTWKVKREYDKHLACCEFFHCLRTKSQTEMSDYSGRIPTHVELCVLVQELINRVEKQDKEIQRLRKAWNTKTKKVVTEWLDQPSQMPLQPFEEWWHTITVEPEHLQQVFKYDLIDGIKMCIQHHLQLYGKTKLPIRAFTQKQLMFYVYSQDLEKKQNVWRIMNNMDLEKMLLYLSQQFLREFLKWQKTNSSFKNNDDEENTPNETLKDKELNYMIKINGMKMTQDKRASEVRKWLFPLLEENLSHVDYE